MILSQSSTKSITGLYVNESIEVKSGFVLGFGPAKITVDASDHYPIITDGFVLLFYIKCG